MRNLCARAGLAKIFTSGYHPQCNAMVERFNRTMAADLSKTILSEGSWPEHKATCAFSYNSNVDSAKRETPYRAIFGVDCFN
jgi:transposase InsO family protein